MNVQSQRPLTEVVYWTKRIGPEWVDRRHSLCQLKITTRNSCPTRQFYIINGISFELKIHLFGHTNDTSCDFITVKRWYYYSEDTRKWPPTVGFSVKFVRKSQRHLIEAQDAYFWRSAYFNVRMSISSRLQYSTMGPKYHSSIVRIYSSNQQSTWRSRRECHSNEKRT